MPRIRRRCVGSTGLGRQPRFLQVAWASIEQSVERGDFDVGLSGLEDRPELRARHAVSIPYYEFREVLAVRPTDRERFKTLADLGKCKKIPVPSVKVSSPRTSQPESGNSEGLKSLHLGDGVNLVMRTGNEYDDIMPV